MSYWLHMHRQDDGSPEKLGPFADLDEYSRTLAAASQDCFVYDAGPIWEADPEPPLWLAGVNIKVNEYDPGLDDNVVVGIFFKQTQAVNAAALWAQQALDAGIYRAEPYTAPYILGQADPFYADEYDIDTDED